jgi:hypothetical protein
MSDLSEVLKERVEEEKKIVLRMLPGKKPEIVFSGFWSGKYIKAAMDSIAKAYRLHGREVRRTPNLNLGEQVTPQATVVDKKE